jgi:HAD superfamily hydrolase (TIGR01509 family)
MRAHADVDALTLDALGTLVRLPDPTPALRAALQARGIERGDEVVRRAFRAEVAHYKPRCAAGRDDESLAALREECVGVFLRDAGAELDPPSFVEAFVGALAFEPEPGVEEAVDRLAAAGVPLAVVSNWDMSLEGILTELGLAGHLRAVVTSAAAGASKPDPAIFAPALTALGSTPQRTLHVGDEAVDEDGAAAAGLRFRPSPLAGVVAELLG